ncbi:hypothetical protein AB0K14_38780 [Actinosynnema sp. NPDC050801]|uniref:hypothetical protein n=1 Tax=unclassified Actinosynnema TaxID=2637065 RepID=UPI0033FA1464
MSSSGPSPPQDVPADLTLPLGGAGVTVDDSFYAEWIPAATCPLDADDARRATMESDVLRTGFRTATQVADTTRAWQLGVYPDADSAHLAFTELHAAIDRCRTGAQTDRHPRDDLGADEAFIKFFYNPAGRPGDQVYGHYAHVVARVGNALVAHKLEERDTVLRDPLAPDEPAAVAVRRFLSQLCEQHRWCRGQ